MSIKATGIITAIALAISISGCNKKTSSEFVLEDYEYSAGETIKIVNLSPKKRKQVWVLRGPDGNVVETKEEKNPQFILSILAADGTYNLELSDNDWERAKKVHRSKTFMVKTVKGTLFIDSYASFGDGSFKAYCDGVYVGSGNENSSLEVDLPIGARFMRIEGTYENVEQTVNLTEAGENLYVSL